MLRRMLGRVSLVPIMHIRSQLARPPLTDSKEFSWIPKFSRESYRHYKARTIDLPRRTLATLDDFKQ